MVSDTTFYIVLGIAITTGSILAVFLGFMVKMMKAFPPIARKVLTTLHAALFGYEAALVDLIGPRGYKTHVFPKIVELMATIKGEDPLIDAVVNAKTPKEAMEKWIEVLKLANVSQDAHLTDHGNDHFTINIPTCNMCDPIHEVMGPDVKGICPMGLIVAAASGFVESGKNPVINYSKFFPTGTSTDVSFEVAES